MIPLPDGSALFYGGGIATCMDVARYPSAELWDAEARAFRRAGRTELPHWDEATALLPDGRVAVIGGIGTEDYSCGEAILGSIELWDPATRTFSVAGALELPRSMATAITLDDGSVLILGGADRMGDPVAAAENLDAARGRLGAGPGARHPTLASGRADAWHHLPSPAIPSARA